MDPHNFLVLLLVMPAFVSALTVHEFAHAWMAHRLGDDTAKHLGRLSLDPLVHLDFLGTAIMVLAILSGWPLVGWAKPVPVNPNNFENRRRDDVLVAIAGPISNIIQAAVWLALLVVLLFALKISGNAISAREIVAIFARDPSVSSWVPLLVTSITYGVLINVALAVFNMLPLPPLDGHWVLMGLEIPAINRFFETIRPFSFVLVMMLVAIPPFRDYFIMYMSFFMQAAYGIVGRVVILFL